MKYLSWKYSEELNQLIEYKNIFIRNLSHKKKVAIKKNNLLVKNLLK